jgi:hypothetical protein
MEVAKEFEQTVSAMQERETKIQHARQSVIRLQVETAGSSENFQHLSAWVDSAESGKKFLKQEGEGLLESMGGETAGIMAEARAYRFSRRNVEQGKTALFKAKLKALKLSPTIYRKDQYFAVLGTGLAKKKKVLFSANVEKTIIRLGLGGEKAGGFSPIPVMQD